MAIGQAGVEAIDSMAHSTSISGPGVSLNAGGSVNRPYLVDKAAPLPVRLGGHGVSGF
jgi:hypothetical protein